MRWVSGGFGVWVDLGLGLGLRTCGVWDRSCRAHTVLDSIPSCQHHPQDADDAGRDREGGGGVRGPGTGTYIYIYICIWVCFFEDTGLSGGFKGQPKETPPFEGSSKQTHRTIYT